MLRACLRSEEDGRGGVKKKKSFLQIFLAPTPTASGLHSLGAAADLESPVAGRVATARGLPASSRSSALEISSTIAESVRRSRAHVGPTDLTPTRIRGGREFALAP